MSRDQGYFTDQTKDQSLHFKTLKGVNIFKDSCNFHLNVFRSLQNKYIHFITL